jgi:Domain of unknown function (DUF4129)
VGSTGTIRLRSRWLLVLAGVGFAIACFAATAGPAPTGQRPDRPVSTAFRTALATTSAPDVAEPQRAGHWHFGVPDWLLRDALTLLMGVGAVLAILLIIRLVPKLQRRPRRRRDDEAPVVYAPGLSPEQVSKRVSDTLDDALDAFRRGDRERAIIACWIRLEQIAEQAGFARLSSETSSELAARWLTRLPVSRAPLFTLAELYREARYSSHRLDEAALVTARGALEQLRREISPTISRNSP